MTGTVGQNYALLASTNLVNWVPALVFLCTDSPMLIYDPMASNFNRRFYRIGSASVAAALAPPKFGLVSPSSSTNAVTLMLSCLPGVNYRVEASTNLANWTTITSLLSTTVLLRIHDTTTPNSS